MRATRARIVTLGGTRVALGSCMEPVVVADACRFACWIRPVVTRALVAITLVAGTAFGGIEKLPHDDKIDADSLTAKELHKYFEPYLVGIRDCYAANAKTGDGTLRLELIIHRDGTVFKFGFTAPGVPSKAIQELDHCLRPLSETWHFPVRRGFTSAVVPFLFVHTHAPGAGPKMGSDR